MLRFSWEKSALLKCLKKPERSFDLKFKNISNFAIKNKYFNYFKLNLKQNIY